MLDSCDLECELVIGLDLMCEIHIVNFCPGAQYHTIPSEAFVAVLRCGLNIGSTNTGNATEQKTAALLNTARGRVETLLPATLMLM